MTSQAKAGQIMITGTMAQRVAPEWRSSVRQIDVTMLKGKSNEDELFEVLWQKEDATSMLPSLALGAMQKKSKQRLHLHYHGTEVLLTDSRPGVNIGRAEENDIVIKGNLISRLHARIEFTRNKFVLIDQSTNGTFVLSNSGEESFVRRDSIQLKGEGLIGFGKTPDASSPQHLRYVCEE